MTISGGCFCGAIRYEISGELHDARSCHCSQCRKAFSAQASAYATVDPDGFRWLSGETLLTSYASRQGFGLQFCSVCGSTLCGVYQGRIHGVTLGTVDGDPGVSISYHLFVASRAPWEIMPDGITAYDEGPPQ
jgi:hypothetical protein